MARATPEQVDVPVGERLRDLAAVLHQAGMSRQDVAERLGIEIAS